MCVYPFCVPVYFSPTPTCPQAATSLCSYLLSAGMQPAFASAFGRLIFRKRFSGNSVSAMSMTASKTIATLAVNVDGTVTLDPTQEAAILEEAPSSRSSVRTIWLNRPKSLHALSTDMIERLDSRLSIHESNPFVKCIVLRSTGKAGRAFCAGGDIKGMYNNIGKDDYGAVDDFFRTEYAFNYNISQLKTPVLSVWDGIVMGGGVGLSIHGRFRIATQNTVFAMPECNIGLHPDIGASYVLPRLTAPENARALPFANYLALTGARVKGLNAHKLGLATHFIEAHYIDAVIQRLESVDVSSFTAIDKVLQEYSNTTVSGNDYNASLWSSAEISVIERCFSLETVEEIVAALQKVDESDDEAGFAKETLGMLKNGCPMSQKISLESMKRGEQSSLAQCLEQEFWLSVNMARNNNLIEGVRAAVVDRTKRANWKPDSLEDITKDEVDKYFLPRDNIEPIELNTHESKAKKSISQSKM